MLTKNMKIELDIEQGLHQRITLYSVIEDICEDGGLLIHTPVYQRCHYQLHHNTVMVLRFFVGSDLYVIPVMYAGRVTIDGTEYEKLRQIGEIRQKQRNDSYRLPISLPISVECINARNYNQPIQGQTLNISGGGMLLAVSEEIDINEKMAFITPFCC